MAAQANVIHDSRTPVATSFPIELVRWACAILFFARAWQHLRWDAPYRALLWSQNTMEGFVQAFLGMDWNTYATHPGINEGITWFIRIMGCFYVICGIAAITCRPQRRWTFPFLLLGSLSLFFLSYLYYRDKMYRLGEWGEYACQFSIPLVLLLLIKHGPRLNTLQWIIRASVALTFACHGLYAVGFYPTPGEWVTMTMQITGLSDSASMTFLHMAGYLDFAVAALLFAPSLLVQRCALAYAFVWGLLTALARTVAFLRVDIFSESAMQWVHETLIRLPHAALPAALLLILLAEHPGNATAQRPAWINQLLRLLNHKPA